MALNWSTTSRQSASNGVKMLVHAPAGTGKTVLCATLPSPVILSAEAGLLSLSTANITRMFGQNTPGISYDIPVITVTCVADLTEAYDWIVRSHEAKQFQSVALDSVSEIAEVILSNARAQVKDNRQAYGELNEKLATTIKMFRDLPGKNVYMTAKQGGVKDEATGMTRYSAVMPSKATSQGLSYYYDEVFRLGVALDAASGTNYRFLQTQPDLQYDAKDRSGVLATMEPPHLGAIIAKITGVV